MPYRYLNQNKYKRHINDCTIRAISLATNKSWNDTYKELADAARRKGMMMDSKVFIEEYLDRKFDRTCHYSKTVGEFMKEFPYGTYLISMPNHLTVVINGVNYDTFDTTKRKMWCAWCATSSR